MLEDLKYLTVLHPRNQMRTNRGDTGNGFAGRYTGYANH